MARHRQPLTRREMLKRAGGVALGAAAGAYGARLMAQQRPSRRANFIFLLTDDQSYVTMGCTGNTFMKTPNLDRLAREGALFTHAFPAMSLCAPSRACFLTGLYPHANGIIGNQIRWNQELVTLPRLLHDAGYETAHMGKFHMDGDDRVQPGYDYWAAQIGQGSYTNPRKNINGEWVDLQGHDTEIITAQAIEFIQRPRAEKPFSLWLAYKSCHGPFTPTEKNATALADVEFKPPQSYFDADPGKPQRVQQKQGGRVRPAARRAARRGGQQQQPAQPLSLEQWAERERNQFRCILDVDDSVGRLLATLAQQGTLDDTIIVHAGDNGFFHGEHGLHGKQEAYEESIRIPMMVRYPREVAAGQKVPQFVGNIDLAPSILDFCGVPIPDHMQGRSWRPLVTGKRPRPSWRREFVYHNMSNDPALPTSVALRTERHKLILNLNPPDIEELYDLRSDPQEMKNLAADGGQKALIRRLKSRLIEEMREIDDPAVPAVEATLKA